MQLNVCLSHLRLSQVSRDLNSTIKLLISRIVLIKVAILLSSSECC